VSGTGYTVVNSLGVWGWAEETLTGFKWMANRADELRCAGTESTASCNCIPFVPCKTVFFLKQQKFKVNIF
jgi:hypothetical protein